MGGRVPFQDLLNDFCPKATVGVPHSFNEYISRGDAFTRALSFPLSLMGKPAVHPIIDRALSGHYNLSDFATPPFIILVIICCIAVVLFLVLVCVLPMCCIAKWRNWVGQKCFRKRHFYDRERVAPLQDTRLAQKFKYRVILILLFFGLHVFGSVLAMFFSTRSKTTVNNTLCQVSRISNEFYEGILYDQAPDESNWLKGLKPNQTWEGEMNILRTMRDYRKNATQDFYNRVQKLRDLTYKASKEITPLLDALEKSETFTKNGNDEIMCVVPMYMNDTKAKSILTNAKGTVQDLIDAGEDGKNLTGPAQRLFMHSVENYATNIHRVLKPVNEAIKHSVGKIRNYGHKISNLVFLVLVVLTAVTFVGLAGALITFVFLYYYKKANKEPRMTSCALGVGVMWIWFAVIGLLFIILSVILLMTVSNVGAICRFVHSVPKDTSVLSDYKPTADWYNDDQKRAVLSSCIGDGDGNFVSAALSGFTTYIASLNSADSKIKDALFTKFEKDDLKKFHDILDLVQLSSNKQPDVLNYLNSNLFSAQNHFLVPDQILYGTTLDDHPSLPPGFDLPSFFDPALQKRQNYIKDYMHVLTKNNEGIGILNDLTSNSRDLSGLKDQLHKIGDVINIICGKTITRQKICITDTTKASYCTNDDTTLHQITLDVNKDIHDVSDIVNSELNYKAEQTDLEDFLKTIKAKYTASKKFTDLYYINVIYVGLRLVSVRAKSRNLCVGDAENAKKAQSLQTYMQEYIKSYNGDSPQTNPPTFHGVPWLQPLNEDTLSCKSFAYSAGSVVDSLCDDTFRDLLYVGIGWAIVAWLSIIGWIIFFKLYHYFLQRIKKTPKGKKDESLPTSASTILSVAKIGDDETLSKLLDHTPLKPNEIHDDMNAGLLHYAAYSGDNKTVQLVLSKGVDLDTPNTRGYTPLAVAVSEGHSDVASLLIKRGANPSRRDEFGETPLHAAARAGNLKCVEALCQPCAPSPSYTNDAGEFAIDTAHNQGHKNVEAYLTPRTPRTPRK